MLQKGDVLGLTGGSGSGKSTVCVILSSLGAYIIDADIIARQIVETDMPAYREIVSAFGEEILMPDKTINRKKLGEIVFSDEKKLAVLNSITHKAISDEVCRLVNENSDKPVVIDAPLLFDFPEILELCTKTAVVIADTELRIRRIMTRDGLSREIAEKRIASQRPQEELAKLSDIVWENNGNTDDLRSAIIEA